MSDEIVYVSYAELDENGDIRNVALFEESKTPEVLGFKGTWVLYVPEESPNDTPPFNGWVKDENDEWQPPADKPYPEDYGQEGTRWYWEDVGDAGDWVNAPLPEEE